VNQEKLRALADLVKRDALRVGDFVLASGKKATFYLDCRKVTLSSQGAALIGELMLDAMAPNVPDSVGGMAIGADPITGAIITVAGQRDLNLHGFIVRKESKQHGTGQMVEGPVKAGMTAMIVEDTVTTGGSSFKAIEHARAFGLEVKGVFAIVDRLEGAAETFGAAKIPFRALLTVRDLGITGP
jgi:orotate phosphoribosyltransferase